MTSVGSVRGRGDEVGDPNAGSVGRAPYQEMTTPPGVDEVEETHRDIVPAKINRYVILRQLGSGGMGVVYAAYDEQLDRKVALKLLSERSSHSDAHARMLREAQALARLDHPNVVAIHDVGVRDGQVFLAMDFLSGTTLRAWLAEAKRTPPEILAVFIEAGRGLEAAHAVGLVHRDFKPDNVMVGADGRVRVFDFGLARATGTAEFAARASRVRPVDQEATDVTATGAAVGTPAYMSPEQHMGRMTDARTDIYSFCVALYEAFYSERPYEGATKDEIANAVIRGERRPLPRNSVPARLRRVILRGLDVDPAARWPTMNALLAALADDPAQRRRRRALIVGAATITLAAALALPYAAVRLYTEWQGEQREKAAALRWETTRAQIDALEANGRREQADRLFTAFTQAEEQLGTRALTRAWLDHGARALRAGESEAATVAYAEAYVYANDPDLEAETLGAMARLFLRNNDWRALHSILDALRGAGRSDDPGVPAIRAEAAIADRDFAGARTLLDQVVARGGEPPPIARARPMLDVLAQAEHLPYRGAEATFADLDGDGRSELLLLAGDWRSLTVLDRDLRLLATHHLPDDQRDAHLVPQRPLIASYTGTELVVATVGVDLRERWRGPAESWAYSMAAADLDGRPGEELYVGLAAYRRGLHVARVLAGQSVPLEIAHRGTDLAASDVTDIMVHDLDGDGEPELIASVGPWKAYDLRVFRAQGGALELVDRLQLGHVFSIAPLRMADGTTVIAAAKDDRWPDRRVFPEPPHLGWPAGIYLIGFADGHLERRGHIPPIPNPSPRRMIYGSRLRAGDFDGDGLEDLAITQDHGSEHLDYASLILRQHEGGFTPIPMTAMQFLAAGDLDDDPEPELLIADSTQGNALWLLGRGRESLPRAISKVGPKPAPPPQLLAHGLREGWTRAERLAEIGLFDTAAESLHASALITTSPGQARLLLGRAAALRATGGDHEGAVELYQLLAERGGLDELSRHDAARSYVRLARYEDAYTILAGGDVDSPSRGADELRRGELRQIVDPRRLLDVTFDRPLPREWRIHDPLALTRDADADVLRVTAFNGGEAVAELPLAWDRGSLVLSAELTLVHSEFAGDFDLSIADAEGAPIAGFHVQTRGGGGLYDHHVVCHHEGATNEVMIAHWPFTGADVPRRIKVDVVVLPDRNVATCRVDGEPGEVEVSLPAQIAPGPTKLVLGSNVRWDRYTTHADVALHRVTIRGGGPAIVGDTDDDPRQQAARLLSEGEPTAALRLLDALAEHGPRDHLWRALARYRLGDIDGAGDELAAVLAATPPPLAADRTLLYVLRRHPELTPLLRQRLGPEFYDLYRQAWEAAIEHHPDEPFVHEALIDAVSELSTPEGLDPTPSLAELLAARGRVWLDVDELARARRELIAADRMADAVSLADPIRFRLTIALAELAARSGDRSEARRLVGKALELTLTPELAIERLRRHPRLAELVPSTTTTP